MKGKSKKRETALNRSQQWHWAVVAGLSNHFQVLAFQLMAPLGLTPPAWLFALGKLFMGRGHAHRQQVSQI